MRSPAKFREYAEQCKQLAKSAANEKDRVALLEIAEAWKRNANQLSPNRQTRNENNSDGSGLSWARASDSRFRFR
jgi:hypothetical protein